jgi:hypothetical protein
MSEEIDRKLMPEFMQTTFAISLGAFFKSFEMMMTPQDSAEKMFGEMKSLITIPDDAGEGLQKKVEALAGNWMAKAAGYMEVCKTTGERFTEGK